MFRLCSLVVSVSRCLNVLYCLSKFFSLFCFSKQMFPCSALSQQAHVSVLCLIGSNERLFILICTFSGKSPLSSHKTTLKQQINGLKRLKTRQKNLPCFGCVFVACSVLHCLEDCWHLLMLTTLCSVSA